MMERGSDGTVPVRWPQVTETPQQTAFEIVCPHCRKPCTGERLAGAAPRYEGFKCPHCRLFVPRERANGDSESPQ
jgi:DNA-directed RNA polymerase subunit RPC12/RpoP